MHEKDAQRLTTLMMPGVYLTTSDARELEQLKRGTLMGKKMAAQTQSIGESDTTKPVEKGKGQ